MADDVYDAATVLVLREGAEDVEIFMVKRHSKSSFMANAYVYPGGRVDDEDCEPDVAERVEGLTGEEAADRLGVASPERALGFYLAAVRETFEEAGILLARRADESNWIDLTDEPDVKERFGAYREKLTDYEMSLHDLVDDEDLIIPLSDLELFAHWITPKIEPKRFDTFFFLARAPKNQTPLHDERETTESLWISPGEALERYRDGTFFLAPPTLRTLERLNDFDSTDEAFEAARSETPPTIVPHFDTTEEGDAVLLLPGDVRYPAGEYTGAEPGPAGDPTRLVLRDGQWWPATVPDDV